MSLRRRGVALSLAGALLLAASAHAARAKADILSANTVGALVDFRGAAVGGERSWTDGGFGKLRFGGGDDPTAEVGDAAVIWKPRFTWALSGYASAEYQPEQSQAVDLTEAFVSFKPAPHSDFSYSARAGLYWPEVSLEHDGLAWSVSRTLTPSAINSWVAEEVKVIGGEATVRRHWPAGTLSATAGIFAGGDTAGTLLSFRGWALHDVRAGAFGSLPLPPLSAFITGVQPRETYIAREIDGHPGYYGRVEWRAEGPLTANIFYYDNHGDPEAVDRDGQWGWRTRFWNAGVRLDVDANTQILAQGATGVTRMGYPTDEGIWVDTAYASAYLLASRRFGRHLATARADVFRVRDRTLVDIDNNDEHGWALTADWRYELSPHAQLFVEALHVSSTRPSRALAMEAAFQVQTLVQTSVRLHF